LIDGRGVPNTENRNYVVASPVHFRAIAKHVERREDEQSPEYDKRNASQRCKTTRWGLLRRGFDTAGKTPAYSTTASQRNFVLDI
jgi:hypothetical protein